MSHFRKGAPPSLPHRIGAPEGMGAERSREGGAEGALLPLRDQEKLGSMINHFCSFRHTLFFFLQTDTRAQKILYFLNSKTIDCENHYCYNCRFCSVAVFFGEGES